MTEIKKMTLEDFALLEEKTDVLLIDVREEDEYRAGHLPKARNLPLSRLVAELSSLDKNQTYYVICKAGVRSQKACELMQEEGIETVNLTQGMEGYQGPVIQER